MFSVFCMSINSLTYTARPERPARPVHQMKQECARLPHPSSTGGRIDTCGIDGWAMDKRNLIQETMCMIHMFIDRIGTTQYDLDLGFAKMILD